jgi:hypothetical protein
MSDATDRRSFLRSSLAAAATLGLGAELVGGCGSSPGLAPDLGPAPDLGLDARGEGPPVPDASPLEGPRPDAAPAPRPLTTVRQRIAPVLPAEKQGVSTKAQWGVTGIGPGEPHLRRDLLKVDATAGAPTGAAASLLYLAQISDVHVIDEESPARTINLDKLFSPAWRAQEAHATHVLDATVRKLRAFDAFRALDLLMVTGDCIDNNQKNELSWFLKVLEGGTLQPNSGGFEDPRPGADNDPHDAFQALGLGTIPWYLAMGNHDALIQGNLPHGNLLDHSLVTGDPTRGSVGSLDLGRVNPPACNPIPQDESPTPDRCVPTWPSGLKSGSLPADPERKHLSRADWRAAVSVAGGSPLGHGLLGALAKSSDGDFVVEPVAGLPLRLIVLNTASAIGAQGTFGGELQSFLDGALAQAEKDACLVIVASHHPSGGIPVNGDKLRERLNGSPNVILHLVGHEHANQVIARPGADPLHGYFEVQTCSLAEWPQQARLIELVDRRDGTAELWMTMVDYETDHGTAGAIVQGSRFLALREIHAGSRGKGADSEGKPEDRNVILPVALPPAVRARLAALPGQPIESKLFT